jgi:hypothetical protein
MKGGSYLFYLGYHGCYHNTYYSVYPIVPYAVDVDCAGCI